MMDINRDENPWLHPEASSLLDLFQYPDMLETRSVEEIQAMFHKEGYKASDKSGEVTIGWGRKVKSPHASTSVLIATRDGRIVSIFLGGKGLYELIVFTQDRSSSDSSVLREISSHMACFQPNQGKTFAAWWERMKRDHDAADFTHEIPPLNNGPVQQSRHGLREIFRNLFRRGT